MFSPDPARRIGPSTQLPMSPRGLANGNGHAHREAPSSGRAGRDEGGLRRRREPTSSTTEEGGVGTRGRAGSARPKDHKLWPSPWMRANWDPENPLDFNKPRSDDCTPLETDDLETRTFQPAFTMDLNDLVESLWTPPKLPPPPPPPPAREEVPSSRRAAQSPQIRRQRSGSPTPAAPTREEVSSARRPLQVPERSPQPSIAPRKVPSTTVRDVQRTAPHQFDGRRSVDEFDFRSRRYDQSIDLSMSHHIEARRSNRPAVDLSLSFNMEARRRDVPAPIMDPRKSYDMDARRRQPTADSRMREMESWSRREAAPAPSSSRDTYDDARARRHADNGQRAVRVSKDMDYASSSRRQPEPKAPTRTNGHERDRYVQQQPPPPPPPPPSSRRRVAPPTSSSYDYYDDRGGGGYSSGDNFPIEMKSARDVPRRNPLDALSLRRIASEPPDSQLLRPERRGGARYEPRF